LGRRCERGREALKQQEMEMEMEKEKAIVFQ
jgi:hypothetical protein